eukprot:9499570-Pyramimonas_sp.AAC.1
MSESDGRGQVNDDIVISDAEDEDVSEAELHEYLQMSLMEEGYPQRSPLASYVVVLLLILTLWASNA